MTATSAPPTSRRSRVLLAVAGVAVAVIVLGVVLTSRLDVDARAVQSALVGRPAPAFDLEKLDGPGRVALADLRGQIVVVNFWASWCVPCRAEHPELTATAAAYADDGVQFVGVVYQDKPEAARAFLDELGRSYPSVLDPGSKTAIDFGLFGVPETFVIDRNGIVAGNIAGPVDRELLGATIDQVLARA